MKKLFLFLTLVSFFASCKQENLDVAYRKIEDALYQTEVIMFSQWPDTDKIHQLELLLETVHSTRIYMYSADEDLLYKAENTALTLENHIQTLIEMLKKRTIKIVYRYHPTYRFFKFSTCFMPVLVYTYPDRNTYSQQKIKITNEK